MSHFTNSSSLPTMATTWGNLALLPLDWHTHTTQAAAFAAGAGVVSHLSYFIRGEHHTNGPTIVVFFLSLLPLLTLAQYQYLHLPLVASVVQTATLVACFVGGLYGSMCVYRGVFHPLRKFDGPFLARFSNLYHSWLLVERSDNYRLMTKLHEKYGPVVRTGPSNLSVNLAEAVQVVLGPKSKCSKSPWYDSSLPLVNLHTARDLKVHELRRKDFNKAFSPAALVDYEERVTPLSNLFCDQIASFGGAPVNATAWFKYFAFDAMGELGLGESFHMLEKKDNRWVPDLLMAGMADIAQLQPIPWSTPILHRIPFTAEGPRKFIRFIEDQVRQRKERGSSQKKQDILGFLLASWAKSEKKDADYQWLRGDARLVIVGGSDTTASTLTFIFHYLAKYPDEVRKLRDEFTPLLAASGKDHLDAKDVAKAVHLNGVIHETLRLNPPIPSGFPRVTPPEGITIAGRYIPGGTTVVIPLRTLGRSEACYERALEFVPERWYSRPDMIKHKDAFASFGLGPYSCIGRALSLVEMRNLIVKVLTRFDVEFAPAEDGQAFMEGAKDHFIIEIPALRLVFKERKLL
ncbi:cytochrome P450 [Chaetomidium leptoderma]|uniref:Cytochrome P450 n=1 Tax=Chaetomidium leptoderma TaxID=669021 RepID=A0AAN6VQF3_9PEZI|nr:cytochrome P450 [Chaetomidium leptoderma]